MRRFQVLVILLVCCLAFSTFVGCGTQKEEPAMKTFENKNLSVSYPEDWKIKESVSDLNEEVLEVVSIFFEQPEKTSDKAEINIMINKNFIMPDLPSRPRSERTNEKIGGIDFVVFTDSKVLEGTIIKDCIGRKDRDTIGIMSTYSENVKETVEKILGTLKFKF